MTKLIPAIYEAGSLKLARPINLPEHQQVLLAIILTRDDIPSLLMSKLAEKSESFKFLSDPKEDIYSPSDGEEI